MCAYTTTEDRFMSEDFKINGKTYDLSKVSKKGTKKDKTIQDNKAQNLLFDSFNTKKDDKLDSKELAQMLSELKKYDTDKNKELSDTEFKALADAKNKGKADDAKVKAEDMKAFYSKVLDLGSKDEQISVKDVLKSDDSKKADWHDATEMNCHDNSGKTQDIQGKLEFEKEFEGDNPPSFTITDTSSGSEHVYTYKLVGTDEKTGKPIYKCVSMNDKPITTDNEYTLEVDEKGAPGLVQYEEQNNYGVGLKFDEAAEVPVGDETPEKNLDDIAKESGYRKTNGEGIYYDEEKKVHMIYNEETGEFEAEPDLKFVGKDGSRRYEFKMEDGSIQNTTFDKDLNITKIKYLNAEGKAYIQKDFVAGKLNFRKTAHSETYYDENNKIHYRWDEKEHAFIAMPNVKQILADGSYYDTDGKKHPAK